MKIKVWATCCLTVVAVNAFPQSWLGNIAEFRKEQLRKIEQFQDRKLNEVTFFRDSLNETYASFLEEKWQSFNLYKEERGFKPMPQPPVYDPSATPLPKDEPQPIADIPVVPPAPADTLPDEPYVQPEPEPIAPRPALAVVEFFGTLIEAQRCDEATQLHLVGTSEQAVADFWRQLSNLPVETLVADLERTGDSLQLNDWGMLQLAKSLAGAYINDVSENERVVFSVFMLDQLGMSAKIGRSGNDLYVLLATRNVLSNTSYFISPHGDMRYYVINPDHTPLADIQTCNAQYGDGGVTADLSMTVLPSLTNDTATQYLSFGSDNYDIVYNRNLVDYLSTYPCVDFNVYAAAPVDEMTMQSLGRQLSSHIMGKTQVEAVNYLLHFVQNAFRYETDNEQFGYEKWNFAEETLVSSYSDCDDRAIFFAQLVRNLLGMDVVLVHYPGIHLATAVCFDEQDVTGDYVVVGGRKFAICDPTYINANAGMAMPDLMDTSVEVLGL